MGAFADRTGRKPILLMTSLVIASGFFLSAYGIWKQNLWIVILGRIITGLCASNIVVNNSAISDLSTHDLKAKNLPLVAMANGIGFIVGPFLGGKFATGGFDIPFIFAGIVTIFSF